MPNIVMLQRTWYACCLKVTILLLKKFKWDLMSRVSRLCEKLATPTTCYASASNTHLIPIISIFIIKPDLTLIKSKHRKCTLKLRNRNVIWKVIAGYPGSFDCRESRGQAMNQTKIDPNLLFSGTSFLSTTVSCKTSDGKILSAKHGMQLSNKIVRFHSDPCLQMTG